VRIPGVQQPLGKVAARFAIRPETTLAPEHGRPQRATIELGASRLSRAPVPPLLEHRPDPRILVPQPPGGHPADLIATGEF
jgi:hypothetical protein